MEDTKELYNQLKRAIKSLRRTEVEKLLKKDALSHVPEEEKADICRQLVALRDEKIMAVLAKKLDVFTTDMLQLDFENWNNRNFISNVLSKYRKKFDLNKEEVCEEVFEIACKVDHKPTAAYLIKEKKAKQKYRLLAESSDELFGLLLTMSPETFDADERVEILYRAAMTENGQDRLEKLQKKQYSFDEKNKDGQTVEALLKNAGKNVKRGKNQGQDILRYLQKKRENPDAELPMRKTNMKKEQERPKKWVPITATVVVVAILVIVGIAVEVSQKDTTTASSSDNDTTTATSEESSTVTDSSDAAEETNEYVSDPNRTVEDGDTVNIDYTGYVDDVAFDGGSTNGAGTDLTIGSHSYIDDFEEQLIGYKAGDHVTVNVTFPEEYGNEELNGKEARFEVTINGIYAE